MRDRRVLRLTSLLAAMLLALTACGGGGGSDARRDEIVDTLTSSGQLDEDQANCVYDALADALGEDELESLDLEAEEIGDPEVQEAFINATTECLQGG